MKQVILTFSILGLLLFHSCLNRSDKVFSAFDELHSIILFEERNEFELLYNGLNTAIGNYSIQGDTIILIYAENQFEEFDPNEILTQKILIDEETKRVESIDARMPFCANIDVDIRKIKTSHNNK
jgi:hypothetical protein